MKHTLLKKAFSYGAIGLPIGLSLALVIPLAISLGRADGTFYAVVPELSTCYGTEVNAVLLQAVLCAVMGVIYGAVSVVWQAERLPLAVQCLIDFAVRAATYAACSALCYWYASYGTLLRNIAVFVFIYVAILLFQLVLNRCRVKKLNEKVSSGGKENC